MLFSEIKGIPVAGTLAENEAALRRIFDRDGALRLRSIVSRDGSNRCLAAWFEGMTDSRILDQHILRPLTLCRGPLTAELLSRRVVTADGCRLTREMEELCGSMVQGDAVIFLEGDARAVIASARGYQTRAVEEPEAEKSLRGPRQGFTESLIGNMALLRRCLQTTDLKLELQPAAEGTRQQLCLCYLDSAADREVLAELRARLARLTLDCAFSANDIEERIRDAGRTPLKTVGSTERPDIAAAKLLEGRIAILIDGSPEALTVPHLFLEYFQTGGDYYANYWLGSVQRILRILGVFLSVSIPGLYISLICFHQEMLPVKLLLSIAAARSGVPFSAVVELFLLLAAFELLGQAAVSMPQGVGNALSTVGGVIIGQAAVDARFISAPLVIVVALTGLTDLMVPKMKEAMLTARTFLLLLSAVIGLYGYILGLLFLLTRLLSRESFGVPYLSHLDPWRADFRRDGVLRAPLFSLRRPNVRERKARG